MNLVTSREMVEIDRSAQEEFGIPALLLMENAGQKALSAFREEWERGTRPRLVFAAGKGNNGGDALVMARQAFIDDLGKVTVVPVSSELKGLAATHLDVVRRLGVSVVPWEESRTEAEAVIRGADVVFDGVAGTGIKGGLRSPLSDIVEAINASTAYTVAVDVPSGISDGFQPGSPLVQADQTLTMGLPKRCMYLPKARPACGRIRRISLGFPPVLTESGDLPGTLLEEADIGKLVPALSPDAYKHRRGVIAVFAGARGTSGAAALAATAAARSSAGMVRIFADSSVYPVLASQCRSVMVAERAREVPSVEGHHALVVGPGWGRGENRRRDLAELFRSGLPGVLDADGINILAETTGAGSGTGAADDTIDLGGRWVLTPHAGELARLTGGTGQEILAQPFEATAETARRLNAVVVLKSHVTVIAAPDGRYAVVDGLNPSMGTGGTGDVLAGIIGGFLARGVAPYEAGCAGAKLHDAVGKRCAAEKGHFLAEDLLEFVSAELSRQLE
jgi:NAD(P)H-hydrate epimerase